MMQVVIANRLRDGLVVFLAADGSWAEYIDGARLAKNESESEEIIAVAQRGASEQDENQVIDPQLIDVIEEEGGVRPLRLRELIRAQGPTTRTDLGKQAER
jgi:hypothetical protein